MALPGVASSTTGEVTWKRQSVVVSDAPGVFNVSWWVEDDVMLFVEVFAETAASGWAGFGLNTKGDMAGADLVLLSETQVIDCHGDGRMPVEDASQDYAAVLSETVDGVLHVVVERSIAEHCDPNDFDVTSGGTTRLLWALPGGAAGSAFPSMHAPDARGVVSVHLPSVSPDAVVPLPDSVYEIDVLASAVAIPEYPEGAHGAGTTYWCETYEVNMTEKSHIVQLIPKIDPAHEGRVHHILVYECPEVASQGHYAGNCYFGVNMPDHINTCNGGVVVSGWAVGGGAIDFPPEAGYAVGGDGSPRHFLVETHYDNPPGREAFVDSSGMTFVITPELREHDVGMLSFGHAVTRSMVIPPQRTHFRYEGWCPGPCSAEALGEQNITAFGIFLHGHTAATRIAARHFRDLKELPAIAVDDNYDFNYQATVPINPPKVIVPGDTLSVTCTYNTVGRDSATVGNFDTASEMCLSYMMYYPKVEGFANCKTRTGNDNSVTGDFCDGGDGDGDGDSSAWLPDGTQRYAAPTKCAAQTVPACGDGEVQRSLGEECDDGNVVSGDGCDAYCFAENDLVCADPAAALPGFGSGASWLSDRTCVARPISESLATPAARAAFAVEQCDVAGLTSMATELFTQMGASGAGISDIALGEVDFVISICPGGLTTCALEHAEHDAGCRSGLEALIRSAYCCDLGVVDLGIVGRVLGIIDQLPPFFCGATNINVERGCSACGDGAVQTAFGEACDDGNLVDGDGCSAECQVEPGRTCVAVNGLSLCQPLGQPLGGGGDGIDTINAAGRSATATAGAAAAATLAAICL